MINDSLKINFENNKPYVIAIKYIPKAVGDKIQSNDHKCFHVRTSRFKTHVIYKAELNCNSNKLIQTALDMYDSFNKYIKSLEK